MSRPLREILLLPVLVLMLSVAAAAEDVPTLNHLQIESIDKSIAWITSLRPNERPKRATGFVIQRPKDHKSIIITAGHVALAGGRITARFPGMPEAVQCDLLDFNDEFDLMAVIPRIPIPVAALDLSTSPGLPNDGEAVCLFGCAGGLDSSHPDSTIRAKPIKAADLPDEWYESVPFVRKTPRGNTVLVRHRCLSAPGMSGGPLIDRNSKVVAIHIGVMPDGPGENFAVSVKHVSGLKLNSTPDPSFNSGLLASLSPSNSPLRLDAFQPLPINVHGQTIDVRCVRNGYAPADAARVIRDYIPDPDQFRKSFGADRLQRLLNQTPLTILTNPTFGFNVLIPKAYLIETEPLDRLDGISVTLRTTDLTVAAPFNQVTIRAFLTDQYYLANKTQWDQTIEESILRPFGDKAKDPFWRSVIHRNAVRGAIVGRAAADFENSILGLTFRDGNSFVQTRPPGEVFRKQSDVDSTSNRFDPTGVLTPWYRVNYLSENGDSGHAVHCNTWENVCVLVHYQFRPGDREDYFSGKPTNRTFVEQQLIRSSISLY